MFCEVLYSYQYVKQRTEITDTVTEWLYEHTSGNICLLKSLIQEQGGQGVPRPPFIVMHTL